MRTRPAREQQAADEHRKRRNQAEVRARTRIARVEEDQHHRRDDRAARGGRVTRIERELRRGGQQRCGHHGARREPEHEQAHVEAVEELPGAVSPAPVEQLGDHEQRTARGGRNRPGAPGARQADVWSVQASPSQ